MPMKGDSRPIMDRIQEKLQIAENGCIEFTGCLADGYGYISSDIPGESAKRVHVVMWVYHNGPIPKRKPALCVLHKCDNRSCCNVDHLFLGTRKDNNDDMYSKGRAILSHKGERNPSAKLTEVDVRRIRSSRLKNVDLAKKYKVTPTLIASIRKHKIWKDV